MLHDFDMFLYLSTFLAEVTLEDVFKSTQENMNEGPGSGKVLALVLGAAAIGLLLAGLQVWRKREAAARPVNSQGRLLKDISKALGLKSAELRRLKDAAGEQSCASPLTLLLCPSLMDRAAQGKSESEQQSLQRALDKARAEQS